MSVQVEGDFGPQLQRVQVQQQLRGQPSQSAILEIAKDALGELEELVTLEFGVYTFLFNGIAFTTNAVCQTACTNVGMHSRSRINAQQ